MEVVRIKGLPDAPLAAAAEFHGEWLPILLNPTRPSTSSGGEGDHAQHGGGVQASGPDLSGLGSLTCTPPPSLRNGPPPPLGEDLLLIFPPADHSHRLWRLAAVQELARAAAPRRVNGVAADSDAAISSAMSYLEKAPGVTGQYWLLDAAGAEGA